MIREFVRPQDKFGTVLGIKDRFGNLKILGQEMMFSEYRFKTLKARDIIRAVVHELGFDKPDNNERLLVNPTSKKKIYENPSPQSELFSRAYVYNILLERWEMWTRDKNWYVVTVGETLNNWVLTQVKEEK